MHYVEYINMFDDFVNKQKVPSIKISIIASFKN
jgi:hypothetical protein